MTVFSHTRLTTCLGLVCFALLFVVAPSAMADNCNAPPGTSGIDQYCEAIPTPGGSNGPHRGAKDKVRHLAPDTTRTLEQSGSDGAAVLALTKAAGTSTTTPAKKAPAKRHHKNKATGTTTQTPAANTPPAAQDTTPAANTSFGAGSSVSGSLGIGFIAVLAGIGLLLGALAWFGPRRSSEPGEPADSRG